MIPHYQSINGLQILSKGSNGELYFVPLLIYCAKNGYLSLIKNLIQSDLNIDYNELDPITSDSLLHILAQLCGSKYLFNYHQIIELLLKETNIVATHINNHDQTYLAIINKQQNTELFSKLQQVG